MGSGWRQVLFLSLGAGVAWLTGSAFVQGSFAALANDLPQVNFQADPRRGDVPLTVHFTNTSNDPDGITVKFLWSFGDGATSTEESPTHTYLTSGKFDVTLSATDDQGGTDAKTAKGFITVDPPRLVAALLPLSRSVPVGSPATVFASVINPGNITAEAVAFELNPLPTGARLPATLTFQTTDAANQPSGVAGVPVDIPAGKAQSYLITIVPTAAFEPTELTFDVSGSNTSRAHVVPGVNTLFLAASVTPVADVVALAATLDNDGLVKIPGSAGTGVFAVATVNLGVAADITVSADTGDAGLPVALSLCQTDSATGQCLAPPADRVTTRIDQGATPTFGVFVTGGGSIAFDPATNRLFVRFTDASGVIRGATSVAVRTR